MNDLDEVNKVYNQYFSARFPANDTVVVKELPQGAPIQISMIASK